ncbi:Serine/threonine protein kinase [Parafrankia irregularis]|uniref:non-specific serine/threonine protein kinase n=1 Tax=Parafrankia irregularis TaxID=795642 RepID=A0A0S4QDC3_9ACTN|nr:serine/threonine-protein kinase [Parafrankia sp. CH37]CUU53505.1 Serine/threonine protein kinase [Parafrankia irregularis]
MSSELSGGVESVGRVVAGRYRLLDRIGSGAYGTVWRAIDDLLDVSVAVKEVRIRAGESEQATAELITRVEREARAVAKLREHPNVVTILDVVRDGDLPWIVMEWVPSISLAQVLHERGALSREETARIGLAILDALVTAHSAGIVHRDVKPANILIGDDDRVVLVDFGVAAIASDPTITDGLIGTLAYMAPELFEGARALPATDVFALGVTLYCAMEGATPFTRATDAATIAAVLRENPRPPASADQLTSTVLAMLDKDPLTRITASAARSRLVAAADSSRIPVVDPTAINHDTRSIDPIGAVDAMRTEPVQPEPARHGEAWSGRAAGLLSILVSVGAAAAPWTAEVLIDLPDWLRAVALFWSALLGCWAVAFAYLFSRPDFLSIGPAGISYRCAGEDFTLTWEQIRSARVVDDHLEIELADGTQATRYRERRTPPKPATGSTLVFCRLTDLRGASAAGMESAIRSVSGTAG